mmetsp:Transcript_12700/g.44449  ORF Transcript_12700/g.44449 Transcript_12700/m.44449 type:complete len:220 (-) Transcript_12700:575-1234(-)
MSESSFDGREDEVVATRKRLCDCSSLASVSYGGGGGMAVDVADLLRANTAHVHGSLHDPGSSFAIFGRRSDMIGVASRAPTPNLGINPCSPASRHLQLLKHQHGTSLPHHKTASPRVEGSRGRARVLVELACQGLCARETGDGKRLHARFRSSCQRRINFSQCDHFCSIHDIMSSSSAGCNHCVVRSPDSMSDRNVPSSHVEQNLGNEEWRELARAGCD